MNSVLDENHPDLRHVVGLRFGDTSTIQSAVKVGCDGIEAVTPITYYYS